MKNKSISVKESVGNMPKSFLPSSYILYACEGEIEENVYYYFQFIVESVQIHNETQIFVHGTKIFNGTKSKQSIMHSKKLRPMFINAKYTGKILHLIGRLHDQIVFFPSFGKITANHIKPVVRNKIKNVPEPLKYHLEVIYNPKSIDEVNHALKMLFTYELSAIKATIKPHERRAYENNPTYKLPFELSQEQCDVVNQIFQMLDDNKRMYTLVHGDVGCGKTVIGYLASLKVVCNSMRVLVLAPNILLAHQTYKVFQSFDSQYKISLYTAKSKDLSGHIIVGTQALLHIDIPNVGLVIIDEQHKFGILQRQKFHTDILMLSATPIPRTHYLAKIGSIKQLKLSQRTNTLVPYIVHESNREKIWDKVLSINDQRIVWICKTIKYAQEIYENLRIKYNNIFLIHGRLEDKQEILQTFSKSYGILISTTVLEVGVDIDIHTIVIDNADQFGLAQLHQLKGRAGRHSKGKCILIGSDLDKLQLIKTNATGHEITQLDLELRGAGSIHQNNQSGKSFLFNKIVLNNKMQDHRYDDLEVVPVSQDIIDFFMFSKNVI